LRVGLRVVGLRVVGLRVGAIGVGDGGVGDGGVGDGGVGVVKMLFAQVAGMFDSTAYGCLQCKVASSVGHATSSYITVGLSHLRLKKLSQPWRKNTGTKSIARIRNFIEYAFGCARSWYNIGERTLRSTGLLKRLQ
jgi:hypothetical protein